MHTHAPHHPEAKCAKCIKEQELAEAKKKEAQAKLGEANK